MYSSLAGLMSYSYFCRCQSHRDFLEVNAEETIFFVIIRVQRHHASPCLLEESSFDSHKNSMEYSTWVMKPCEPVEPSSSAVLNRKMTEFLKPECTDDSARSSSIITPIDEASSPAPGLQLYTLLTIRGSFSISKWSCLQAAPAVLSVWPSKILKNG